MSKRDKQVPARSQRLVLAKLTPPDWFGWLGVAAMLLLPVTRFSHGGGVWHFPLLSLGEWLLLPLGALSLSMGFLSLSRIREKTLLPLWLSAIVPAVLWLLAAGAAMLHNGVGPAGGDIFLSWAVRLLFPVLTFLPLLTMRTWRDRLMRALAAGLAANAVFIFWQVRAAGIAPPDLELLRCGGFLAGQHDYGLMLGLGLPLLAAWRGGEKAGNRALANLFYTFLLPALALSACFGWVGLAAPAAGLAVAWSAWRSQAWIMGVFLCLLVFGHGFGGMAARERPRRALLAESALPDGSGYRRALNTFRIRPYLGSGPEAFRLGAGGEAAGAPAPWYALLLGGTGLAGLGMWLVLLGELAARTLGHFNRRCLWPGGVLGGIIALTAAGLWTDALPGGAGALVGFLVALSILEEPEAAHAPGRPRRTRDPEPPPPPAGRSSGDTDVIVRT